MTITTAPAKIILFGEHAVVYGEPAIAVPVSQLRAKAAVTSGTGLTIVASDIDETLPVSVDTDIIDNALARMARLTLDFFNSPPPNATITVTSEIPLASGLGSGAAVSTALGRAVTQALGKTIVDEDLNRLVYEVERLHHGTPSGIDNTVIVYERAVYFVRGEPLQTLSIGQPITLLIGDTGKTALTHYAVGDVRKFYEQQPEVAKPLIEAAGEVAKEARSALEKGDIRKLGQLADENHSLLQKLTVSSPELDNLVNRARDAGAVGAKLSGGGRGGNMIAFVENHMVESVTAALQEAGAVRVIKTVLKPEE
jgi:mevalonate kinase